MYGTADSSTYEETHANINDSTIKKYIDNWYENNIKNTNSELYLADNLFCNDRSFSDYIANNYNNLGYHYNSTYYRWALGPWDTDTQNKPNLFCLNKNDRFTAIENVYGNRNLKYGISIINNDEAVLAGLYKWNVNNQVSYLYIGSDYFTLSPGNKYTDKFTLVRVVSEIGSSDGGGNVQDIHGVKPVINLKPNSLKLGDGTISNVYRVS